MPTLHYCVSHKMKGVHRWLQMIDTEMLLGGGVIELKALLI